MHREIAEIRPCPADALVVVEALVSAKLYSTVRKFLLGLNHLTEEEMAPLVEKALPALPESLVDVLLKLAWPEVRRERLLGRLRGTRISGRIVPIECQREVIDGTSHHYRWCNPSMVAKKDGGYILMLRGVNYDQEGAVKYRSLSPDGKIRTRNVMLDLAEDFSTISRKTLEVEGELSSPHPLIEGLEDLRPFFYRGSLYVSSSYRSKDYAKMVVGAIQGKKISPVVELESPRSWHEKNWLFDEGRMIFGYPLEVVWLSWKEGEEGLSMPLPKVRWEKLLSSPNLSELRGSAGPLAFEGGKLLLVHWVMEAEGKGRRTLHRFLFYSPKGNIGAMSMPFFFREGLVETCNSITSTRDNTGIIMAVSLEDHEAYLMVLERERVRDMLLPIEFWALRDPILGIRTGFFADGKKGRSCA